MSRGYFPAKDEPGPDEILKVLREADSDNTRLTEMPSEEVARHLVLGGHLQKQPSPALVADMLVASEAEELASRPMSSQRRVILRDSSETMRSSRNKRKEARRGLMSLAERPAPPLRG